MNTQWMDATELAEHIREGCLSSRQAVRQSLDRIVALDGPLHAFAIVLREAALAAAALRDLERETGLLRGALHGVPVAVKDLFDIAGHRTGAGSLSFPDHVAKATASAVSKLEGAGRSSSARRRWWNSPLAAGAPTPCSARRATPMIWRLIIAPPVAPPRARRSRWRAAWCRWPWAPIPAARSASQRPSAVSSAINPRPG